MMVMPETHDFEISYTMAGDSLVHVDPLQYHFDQAMDLFNGIDHNVVDTFIITNRQTQEDHFIWTSDERSGCAGAKAYLEG